MATPAATKLDEIATQCCRGAPDTIARLVYAVAAAVDGNLEPLPDDAAVGTLAHSIANALLAARKPLIVAGTSLYSEGIIAASASLALALKQHGKEVGLVFTVPEVNSIGLAMMTGQFLEDAFDRCEVSAEPGPGDGEKGGSDEEAAIILENDLYERTFKNRVDTFLDRCKRLIVLDYLENATTRRADHLLPAAVFAETDGTVVNNEGRAQRFYAVHVPDNDVRGSWKWLQAIQDQETELPVRFDDITARLVKAFPAVSVVLDLAPSAAFREGTQKIPREPHRYSGRTAIHAGDDVSEPMPPADPDSALSFTMEGYAGVPPPGLTPFYWSPGWNSLQAINKYQIEVGGPLHGGNPGKRLFEPGADVSAGEGLPDDAASGKTSDRASCQANGIPPAFSPQSGRFLVLPLYHIFGSDALSALSAGVNERVPAPYIALNDADAAHAGLVDGSEIAISVNGATCCFRVRLQFGLPPGTAGLPKGFRATAGMSFPFWTTLQPIST